MKVLKKILSWLAWLLIIGGVAVFAVMYLINQSTLNALLHSEAVIAAWNILRILGFCVIGVLVGFIFLSLSLKLRSRIRSKERERARIAAAATAEAEKKAAADLKAAQEAAAEAEHRAEEAERRAAEAVAHQAEKPADTL